MRPIIDSAENKVKNTITFFVMTEKGYKVLEAVEKNFPQVIECVVSSRDEDIAKDFFDEIVTFCEDKNIKFVEKKHIKNITSSYSIAVSWRWLIDAPLTNLIVFHDSLLPKYRGFSPLVLSLINGDNIIGVTALFASKNYDCGDIIDQSSTQITYPIKIQCAIEKITQNYKELALEISKKIFEGEQLCGVKQDEKKAIYSLWRDEADYHIDWTQSAEKIKRFIDAVGYPYKGATTIVENSKARIFESEIHEDVQIANRDPGKIIFIKENMPVIVCGTGLLKITNIIDDNSNQSLLPFSKFRLKFN